MKKRILVLVMTVLLALVSNIIAFASEFIWQDIGRGNFDLKTILLDADNARVIYIGSRNGLSKTDDQGLSWRNILSVRGQNRTVNFLLFDPKDRNSLYAATGNGLFSSPDSGRRWNRIFQGKNSWENECTTLAVLPVGIYLGTREGLFVSKDKGRTWHKETGKLGKSHILAIACNLKEPGYIYIACVDGVFKTADAGKSWERIFVRHPVENDNERAEISQDQDKEERFSDIRYICVDPNNLNYLYLATSKGVYRSQDRGKTWDLLSDYGLLNRDIKFLKVSHKSRIYAIAKSGIFEYRNERWQELSFGLLAEETSFLDLDNQGNLYAACDKGLFKLKTDNFGANTQDNTIMYYKNEPKINEVHAVAIKYAEVEPEKIARWREQAAKKALLPKLSASVNRDTSDLWHWESGSTTKIGDDVLLRGRDAVGWDVTLSWDLSELIWNENQTSIDARSRLMVELRDDILDEVTKLYFERLRVRIELENLSIEDRKKRLEKELKLEELTASLDALTGGYFSQQIKNNKI